MKKEDAYPVLEKLSRKNPNFGKNLPHICSFFAKGSCSRGNECPYRHEIPNINELSDQNIKDRYFGINDPVAKKILKGYQENKVITPPADSNITSLYISGVTDDSIRDKDLIDIFFKVWPNKIN